MRVITRIFWRAVDDFCGGVGTVLALPTLLLFTIAAYAARKEQSCE